MKNNFETLLLLIVSLLSGLFIWQQHEINNHRTKLDSVFKSIEPDATNSAAEWTVITNMTFTECSYGIITNPTAIITEPEATAEPDYTIGSNDQPSK